MADRKIVTPQLMDALPVAYGSEILFTILNLGLIYKADMGAGVSAGMAMAVKDFPVYAFITKQLKNKFKKGVNYN